MLNLCYDKVIEIPSLSAVMITKATTYDSGKGSHGGTCTFVADAPFLHTLAVPHQYGRHRCAQIRMRIHLRRFGGFFRRQTERKPRRCRAPPTSPPLYGCHSRPQATQAGQLQWPRSLRYLTLASKPPRGGAAYRRLSRNVSNCSPNRGSAEERPAEK